MPTDCCPEQLQEAPCGALVGGLVLADKLLRAGISSRLRSVKPSNVGRLCTWKWADTPDQDLSPESRGSAEGRHRLGSWLTPGGYILQSSCPSCGTGIQPGAQMEKRQQWTPFCQRRRPCEAGI